MLEFSLYSDWGKADFHSAVITSFSFNLPYFDSLVLKFLHSNKVVSINLLVDQNMMDMAFESGMGIAYHVGCDYFINGITSQGAFHPKIYFFVGNKSLMMFTGSGNVTFCGNGKNHEIFSGLYADSDNQQELPLLQEAWSYLCRFAVTIPELAKSRILNEVKANCSLLKDIRNTEHHKEYVIDDSIAMSLLYNETSCSLFSQIYNKLEDKRINQITILSPFFDQNGYVITEFSKMFPKAKIDVLISDTCILPPNEMKENKQISFYHFEKTERGKSALSTSFDFHRNLHAKIIHFTNGSTEYLLIGSANATKAAIGTYERQPLNEEFCIMLSSSKKNFLKDLGLFPKVKFNYDISQMKRSLQNETVAGTNAVQLIKIISAEMRRQQIVVKLVNNTNLSQISLCGYIMDEGVLEIANCEVGSEIVIPIERNIDNLIYCELHDMNGQLVSNRQYVNHIIKLSLTNPSKNNKNISSLLRGLSCGEMNMDDIAKYALELFQDMVKDNNKYENSHVGNSKKREVDVDSIKYDIGFDADNCCNKSLSYNDNARNMSALISHIEMAMRAKASMLKDSQFDEEESGDSSLSYDRKSSTTINVNERKKYIKELDLLIENIINAFNDLVNAIIDNKQPMNLSCINAYNLVYELLINTYCKDILYTEQWNLDYQIRFNAHRKFIRLGHKIALIFVNSSLKCTLTGIDEDVMFELSNAINRTFIMFAIMNQKMETYVDEKYYQPIKDLCAYNLLYRYKQYYKWDAQEDFWNETIINSSIPIHYDKIDKWIRKIVIMDSSLKWYEGYGACISGKYINEYILEFTS